MSEYLDYIADVQDVQSVVNDLAFNMYQQGRADQLKEDCEITINLKGGVLAEHDKQIIKGFINKLAEELYARHSIDSSWDEYSANTIIDEMIDISEKMIKSTK